MNFNELSKFIYKKYGLKFIPALSGTTKIYVLKSPRNQNYFVIMSRIKQGSKTISALDLRCGKFSDMIRDLPGFSTPFRLKSSDWVGVWLSRASSETIKSAFNYAFKLTMNDENSINQQSYLMVPGEVEKKYQAQVINFAVNRNHETEKKEAKVPEPIKKMQASYDYSILPAKGYAKNFYHQGKLMAEYRDNYNRIIDFKRYYPTYHDMTAAQARTYFTWRSKIRQKQYKKIDTSYAYVYIYELLNNIGVTNPNVGFVMLNDFLHNYAEKYDLSLVPYLTKWLKDYVIYYHLMNKKDLIFSQEIKSDHSYHILLYPQVASAKEVYSTFANLSSYLPNCLTVKKLDKKFVPLLYKIWLEINHLKKEHGDSFFYQFLARRQLLVKKLFTGAVFYTNNYKQSKLDYIIDEERKYFYQGTNCYEEVLCPIKRQKVELNNFFHEVDRLARIHFKLGHPLKPRKIKIIYLKAIERGILNYQKQIRELQRPKVKIDFSQLKQIRSDASITRDSLLTEEEKQDQNQIMKYNNEENTSLSAKITQASNQTNQVLNKDELFFLLALLQNKTWNDYLKKHHLMVSLLVDQINEKLFDKIGDNVIEFNDQDQPKIVGDYQADLIRMFLQRGD